MRDFTGRELVKLSEVKEGDTLEVGVGNRVQSGTYTIKSNIWGLYLEDTTGRVWYLEDDLAVEYEPSLPDEPFLTGIYHPQPTESPVSNPLSEDEMRAFFERMVTTIVGYSKQDGEIKALQSQVAEVNDKLSRMSEYVVRLEAQNQNLKDANHSLQDTLAERDQTITSLKADLNTSQDRLTSVTNDRDSLAADLSRETGRTFDLEAEVRGLKDTISDKDAEIARLSDQLRLVMEDRDNASKLYSDTRDELSEAQRKLRGVEDAIRNVQAAAANVVNF